MTLTNRLNLGLGMIFYFFLLKKLTLFLSFNLGKNFRNIDDFRLTPLLLFRITFEQNI